MAAKLKDLARSLDLSPATVSRALNGFPEVSEKTRVRVVERARQVGYRPNQLARKLVGGRSGVVALVVPRAASLGDDTSFFGVVAGISTALSTYDMDLMLHLAVGDDEVEPFRRLASKGIVDGFIFNAPRRNDPRIAFAQDRDIPFVVHGRSEPDAHYAYFDIDNRGAAAAATTLLCEFGHRRIALINGSLDHAYAIERRAGFLIALDQIGVRAPEAFIMSGTLSTQHGYLSALRALGGSLGQRPTAFVCASTQIAAGVLQAAADKVLRVPQDLSVVAHDDHVPHCRSAEFSPPLTVTSAPLTDACQPLAELLAIQLEGNPALKTLQVQQSAELIIRKSVAAVPAGEDAPW